jgi:hypothetical protein
MTDTILGKSALKCLINNFGVVETERFISIIIREPFDYTEWQRNLYTEMSVDDLFNAASAWKESSADALRA